MRIEPGDDKKQTHKRTSPLTREGPLLEITVTFPASGLCCWQCPCGENRTCMGHRKYTGHRGRPLQAQSPLQDAEASALDHAETQHPLHRVQWRTP